MPAATTKPPTATHARGTLSRQRRWRPPPRTHAVPRRRTHHAALLLAGPPALWVKRTLCRHLRGPCRTTRSQCPPCGGWRVVPQVVVPLTALLFVSVLATLLLPNRKSWARRKGRAADDDDDPQPNDDDDQRPVTKRAAGARPARSMGAAAAAGNTARDGSADPDYDRLVEYAAQPERLLPPPGVVYTVDVGVAFLAPDRETERGRTRARAHIHTAAAATRTTHVSAGHTPPHTPVPHPPVALQVVWVSVCTQRKGGGRGETRGVLCLCARGGPVSWLNPVLCGAAARRRGFVFRGARRDTQLPAGGWRGLRRGDWPQTWPGGRRARPLCDQGRQTRRARRRRAVAVLDFAALYHALFGMRTLRARAASAAIRAPWPAPLPVVLCRARVGKASRRPRALAHTALARGPARTRCAPARGAPACL